MAIKVYLAGCQIRTLLRALDAYRAASCVAPGAGPDPFPDETEIARVLREALACTRCKGTARVTRHGTERKGRKIVRRFTYEAPCPVCCPTDDDHS